MRGLSGISPANLQRYLKGADYPASKEDLMGLAENNGAPEEIMDLLASMPDVDFDGVQDVQECYSHIMGENEDEQTPSRNRQESSHAASQRRDRDDDDEEEFQQAKKDYEERRRKRQQEQNDDDDAYNKKWDRRLKGHETQAIKDAREMKHGYDGRGRVTDPETDHRLAGNETPAIKDAREMKHGYDGRGRVRKMGDEVDESIADDKERYEKKQRAKEGDQPIDPETGSHSRRRKNDDGEIVRGERETFMDWRKRMEEQRSHRNNKPSQATHGSREEEEQPKKRQTWSEFAGKR